MADIAAHLSWNCDTHTSTLMYAQRFAGPVGQMLLDRQNQLLMKFLGNIQNKSILEIGAGHGQIAPVILQKTNQYIAYGSSQNSFENLKKIQAKNNLTIQYATGTLYPLPYPDCSFDSVISIRSMSHVPDWQTFLKELMRVSRSQVIFDFSPATATWLKKIMLLLKNKSEIATRDFTTQNTTQIQTFLNNTSFTLKHCEGQFMIPLVVHRAVKSKILLPLEYVFKYLQLTKFFGGPVLASIEREHGKS